MTALSLLTLLRERGVVLALTAKGVTVSPASALTLEELADLKTKRDELIALLEGEAEGAQAGSQKLTVELVPAAQFAEEMAGCVVTDHTGQPIALPNVGRRSVRAALDGASPAAPLLIAKPAPLAAFRDLPRVGSPADHLAAMGGSAAVEAMAGMHLGYHLALLAERAARDGPNSTTAREYWDVIERRTK